MKPLGARGVEISHAEGNAASQAVIKKLGFEHESMRRLGHAPPDGTVVGDYRYVLLSADALPPLEMSWG